VFEGHTLFPHAIHMTKKSKGKMQSDADKANDDLKLLIGKRIKRVRNRLDKSAKWVAVRMDMDRSTLSQIENGHIHVNAVTLLKLASKLGCDIRDFFPTVPDSSSLTQLDVELFAQEDTQAAAFLKRAFKPKKHE
jgi:transcriptional regulator with XRE-family HTH domain